MHDQIRDIIQNGKSGQATHEERQKLLSLFHQPEIEFELKSYLFEDLNQTEASPEDERSFEEIFEKFWKNRKTGVLKKLNKIHILRRLVQMAAILAIGLFLGYILDSVKEGSSPVYYTSVAPKGSVSEMFMPDGTHVFLNSGSEIKYSVEGVDGVREIFLEGEALFEVAKMKGKSFLVHTPSYDVRVTGTVFNVKAYPGESETATTLVEGIVQIESSVRLQLANKIELKPGEQLIYHDGSKKISVRKVNTAMHTAWKDNRMIFVNMNMKELKTLLERKFGVEIEIRDQSILQYHYDGTFKNETIFEVLEVLKLTLPIQYHIEDQKIIIESSK
jgi:transmembrane sensor